MPARAIFPLMLVRVAGLPFRPLAALAFSGQMPEEMVLQAEKRLTDCYLALQRAFDAAIAALPESPLRTGVYNARKAFFQRQTLPAAAVLATWEDCAELTSVLAAVHRYRAVEEDLRKAREAYREVYERALADGYRAVQEIARAEPFQRALLYASHTLLAQLPHFCATPPGQFAKKERQTALSLLQYATRMAFKTSPLSHFTTVALHALDQDAGAEPAPAFAKAVVTPNVALLEAIYAVLLRHPVFYRHLKIALNPCITGVSNGSYSWLYFNGEQESFQQLAADPTVAVVVQYLLEHQRRLPFSALQEYLSEQVDATPEALEQFLLQLLDLGLLEWILPEQGLSPGWCGSLYQFLGFLPAEPLIVETAALLQWLRTAGRTLPYQELPEARRIQQETRQQLQAYFERFGAAVPPVPEEQLFFEDVEQPVQLKIPAQAVRVLADQLAECWNRRPGNALPTARQGLFSALESTYSAEQNIDFLEFIKKFLKSEITAAEHPAPNTSLAPASTGSVGALLQCYETQGQWYAVVNGLFPGGGKLFARWLHLFPETVRSALAGWRARAAVPQIAFPWQGWSNANFQPRLDADTLDVPGGRTQPAAGGQAFLLGQLALRREGRHIQLFDRASGQPFQLNDLGLEAPESRSPVMRLLWQLGTPYGSVEALLSGDLWQPLYSDGIRYRARQCYRNLVLARAAWALETTVWQSWKPGGTDTQAFFSEIRKALQALGVPRHFFAHFGSAKPQYFDQNSPLLMLAFQKLLQQGTGLLTLTEMLPLPGNAAVEQDGAVRAAEFVVEIVY